MTNSIDHEFFAAIESLATMGQIKNPPVPPMSREERFLLYRELEDLPVQIANTRKSIREWIIDGDYHLKNLNRSSHMRSIENIRSEWKKYRTLQSRYFYLKTLPLRPVR